MIIAVDITVLIKYKLTIEKRIGKFQTLTKLIIKQTAKIVVNLTSE